MKFIKIYEFIEQKHCRKIINIALIGNLFLVFIVFLPLELFLRFQFGYNTINLAQSRDINEFNGMIIYH